MKDQLKNSQDSAMMGDEQHSSTTDKSSNGNGSALTGNGSSKTGNGSSKTGNGSSKTGNGSTHSGNGSAAQTNGDSIFENGGKRRRGEIEDTKNNMKNQPNSAYTTQLYSRGDII